MRIRFFEVKIVEADRRYTAEGSSRYAVGLADKGRVTIAFKDELPHLINGQLTAINVKHTLVPWGAVAAVAADAERGAGVALLPTANEGGLTDEGAREAYVLDLCCIQHVVDELQAAQATHEGHGDVPLCGQPLGGVEEGNLVHTRTDALARGAVGTDLDCIDAGATGVSPATK